MMNALHCSSTASKREIRCEQVLVAAAKCFRLHGFHAASMQQIADTAGMSVGHIYRYFACKEDIIAAIVAADVADARHIMAEIHAEGLEPRQMLTRCAEAAVEVATDQDRAAMFLEIRAEAQRNPRIAELLRSSDGDIRTIIGAMMADALGKATDAGTVAARVEIFMVLFEGIAVRTARNGAAASATIRPLLPAIMERLLPG